MLKRRSCSLILEQVENKQRSTINDQLYITFPLDSFLQRLELAGFYISPADRLRVLRLLDSLGRPNLREPEKLKTLLCPLIAHSKAGQERFYELFDRYWEDVNRPWEIPPLPEPKPLVKQLPAWVRWLLPVLMIAGLGLGFWKLIEKENTPTPKAFFNHPPTVRLGDTIHFENLSENIDSAALRWEIFEQDGSVPELVDSQSFHLDFVVEKAGKNPVREVRLTSFKHIDPETGKPVFYVSSFRILCNFPPVIDTILAAREVKPKESVPFTVRLADSTDIQLEWDFGDGKTATGSTVQHEFDNVGVFEVRLTATRTGIEGECQVTKTHQIAVGQDKAILAAKPLLPDQVDPMVNFSLGTWILLGLLGLAMIWFWVKWAARKPPPVPDEGEDLTAATERFKAVDKGPYFIPFRSQEGYVRVERELYRLADVLRMRQEGIRKNLDVLTSVKRTIAGGGFPQLVTRADSVPTEYLFLVDEQHYGSHQSNLYRFLVKFLREREVLGEVYFFKKEPIRFWNDQHPDGMSPEQLRRQYPYHRLIVLGDAHTLLDPNASARPQVRPEVDKYFRHWKQRLLLTPMPVVSWTYREGALHGLFAVFPSDTDGIGEAIKFLERGMEEEDLPTYAAWCERLLEGRLEPDVNYRRWRTAAEHRDYLKNHPVLYRWLCALAVYPKPDWNITLAIGHALGTADPKIGVNYDNLLILSRIPWLQSGDLSPRLRKELLAELDPATERIARETVQAELEAVESLVQGSHANQEQQINLAMQNFSLAPQSLETQTVIRQLQVLQLLTPRHIAELNQTVERHLAQGSLGEMSQSSTVHRPSSTVLEFLEENKPKPEPPAKPFFTQNFWLASTATLLYLVIFLFAWNFGGSDQLAKWTGVESTSTTDCKPEYLYGGFLKKECVADSAVLLNNAGVEVYQNALNDTTTDAQDRVLNFNNRLVDAMAYFQRALALKPDYELAKSNLGKAHFDAGKAFYDEYLETPGPDKLPWAAQSFNKAAAFDSVKLDALHGIGLVHFYEEKQDSALAAYELLLQNDSLFFDTLQTYPHLQSLLFKKLKEGQRLVTIQVVDATTNRPVDRVLVTGTNFQGQTDKAGTVQMEMTLGERRVFDFTKKGYSSLSEEIGLTGTTLNFTVKMSQPQAEKPPVTLRSSQSVIYFDLDKTALRQDARLALDSLLAVLMKNPEWTLEVTGHTDAQGTASYNVQISQRMAQAVTDYLAGKGVTRERLASIGKGESQPVVAGNSDQSRAANRRVEIRIVKPEPTQLSTKTEITVQILDEAQKPVYGAVVLMTAENFKPEKRETNGEGRVSFQVDFDATYTLDVSPLTGDYLPASVKISASDIKSGKIPPIILKSRKPDLPIPEMVFVKGGTFRMGCDEKRDGDCNDDEKPVRDVTLDDFSIGKYEVTQELWESVMRENPSSFKDCPKCPVEGVSWNDVQNFIQKLNELTGQKYRLPTEAEWEYAARGGGLSRGAKYSGSNNLGEVAWYTENSGGQTHSVGQKKANELGIFDMSGNVWEWCSDWYDENYYQQFAKGGARNPAGPGSGSSCVCRGGSWDNNPGDCRAADRDRYAPDNRYDRIGFRVAQER